MKKLHVALDDGRGVAPEVLNIPGRPAEVTNADDAKMRVVIAFNPDGIPEELKALPHWVGWKFEARGAGTKPAKVPLNPRTGGKAKANKPETWATFDEAMLFYKNSGCAGLGFFFSKRDPNVGVDLDGCRNHETGEIDPWALEIVQRCDSYTEVSASGKGLHIVVKGKLPGGGKNQDGIEMYDDVHYFAMTGCLLPGTNPAIEDRQDVVLELYASLQGKSSAQPKEKGVGEQVKKSGMGSWQVLIPELEQAELTPAGEEILRSLAAGQFGETYRQLYLGDYQAAGYESHSHADMAMFNLLCWHTGGNPGLMYAIFKETGLGKRDKAGRLDYIARSIQKAIDSMDYGQTPRLRVVTDGWEPEGGPEGNHVAPAEEEAGCGGSPAGAAWVGCTPHTHCGPSEGKGERWFDPQAIPEFGRSPGGLRDKAPSQESLNTFPLYKEGAISSSISPKPEALASAQTSKTSMAAVISQIAMATSGEFTVGEIALALVKWLGISSFPTEKDEWKPWRKMVSNVLNRLVRKGLLISVEGKKGVFGRAGSLEEHQETNSGQDSIIQETTRVDTEGERARWLAFREANRMKPPETRGRPLHILWPLNLQEEAQVYRKNVVVIGGVTNCCKTALGLDFARLNLPYHRITYINSEMSKEELAYRLQGCQRVYGIPWQTFYSSVYFASCNCNALNKKDMDRLVALMDPDGINIIDYMKINDDFYKVGDSLERIHSRLNKGIAVVFFQKDPHANHLLGKSFPEHLARLAMLIDIDHETGLRCLKFTKVKFPTQKDDYPEGRPIWFSVTDGVKLERVVKPGKTRGHKKAEGAK